MEERKHYNEDYDYILYDDGYCIIPRKGGGIITQRGKYGKVMDNTLSYEENCILQIESMSVPDPDPSEQPDKLRADLDFMALMLDVELPSEDEEEGE